MSIETQPQAPTREAIETWLIDWIAREIGMPRAEVDTGKSLLNYSLSSVTAMMLVGDLEEWLGLTLPPTLAWDYPSIAEIAGFLVGQLAAGASGTVSIDGDGWVDGLSDAEVDALLGRMGGAVPIPGASAPMA